MQDNQHVFSKNTNLAIFRNFADLAIILPVWQTIFH